MDDIDYDKTQKKKGGRPPKRNSQIENNGDMQNESASESSELSNETVSENSELSNEAVSENLELSNEAVSENSELSGESTSENLELSNETVSENSELSGESTSENSELSKESASENSEFPKVIFINNKSSTYYIIPQLNMQLRPGEMNASASVEKDQLNQILNNVESFNRINGWDGLNMGVTINYEKEE